MNVRIAQPTINTLLRAVKPFAATRSPITELRGVKLEAFEDEDGSWLLAHAHDGKQGIRMWRNATVNEFGIVLVDAAALTEFVGGFDGLAIIDLKTEGNRLTVTSRQANASFALMDLDRYSDVVMWGGSSSMFTAKANDLSMMIQHVGKFAS